MKRWMSGLFWISSMVLLVADWADDHEVDRGTLLVSVVTTRWRRIEVEVMDEFCEAAQDRHLTPEHVAKILCEDFQRQPPAHWIIISRSEPDERMADDSSSAAASLNSAPVSSRISGKG